MFLFALEPVWLDYLCAVGGLIVGIVGFGFTIWQLRRTMHAAEAAQKAAKETLEESKEAYARFVGAFASRLVSELQHGVNSEDWKLGELRAQDLAELLATLPHTRGATGEL